VRCERAGLYKHLFVQVVRAGRAEEAGGVGCEGAVCWGEEAGYY